MILIKQKVIKWNISFRKIKNTNNPEGDQKEGNQKKTDTKQKKHKDRYKTNGD